MHNISLGIGVNKRRGGAEKRSNCQIGSNIMHEWEWEGSGRKWVFHEIIKQMTQQTVTNWRGMILGWIRREGMACLIYCGMHFMGFVFVTVLRVKMMYYTSCFRKYSTMNNHWRDYYNSVNSLKNVLYYTNLIILAIISIIMSNVIHVNSK
jgi:hypothetical protein